MTHDTELDERQNVNIADMHKLIKKCLTERMKSKENNQHKKKYCRNRKRFSM